MAWDVCREAGPGLGAMVPATTQDPDRRFVVAGEGALREQGQEAEEVAPPGGAPNAPPAPYLASSSAVRAAGDPGALPTPVGVEGTASTSSPSFPSPPSLDPLAARPDRSTVRPAVVAEADSGEGADRQRHARRLSGQRVGQPQQARDRH